MSRHSHKRSVSSGSPQSLRIDSDGIPHFLESPRRSPGLGQPLSPSDLSTLLLGERELARVGGGGGGGLDKAAAEKLIRGAEEEQEKVTLQLLHRLEELNREKANVANLLEQESDQVVHKLLGTHRGADAFVGPILAAATTGAKSAPLSSQARTHGPALIQTLSIDDTFHRLDKQRHQRTQSSTRPTVTSAPWVESSQLGTPSRTTTRHISEPASHSGAATGKPHLLVDYLGHALEEAQALEDRLHTLEAWMAEVHHLAEKFRNEVIELRDKLGIPSADVCSVPPRPPVSQDTRHRSIAASIPFFDAQTPTMSSRNRLQTTSSKNRRLSRELAQNAVATE